VERNGEFPLLRQRRSGDTGRALGERASDDGESVERDARREPADELPARQRGLCARIPPRPGHARLDEHDRHHHHGSG
jgi:hypothetical protein